MRRRLFAMMMLVSAFPAALFAQAEGEKTIRGEIVGLECYMSGGQEGAGDTRCTENALSSGRPAGILEEDTGNFYLAVSPDNTLNEAKQLLPDVAKKVEVKGVVREREGIRTIEVAQVTPVGGGQAGGTTGGVEKSQ